MPYRERLQRVEPLVLGYWPGGVPWRSVLFNLALLAVFLWELPRLRLPESYEVSCRRNQSLANCEITTRTVLRASKSVRIEGIDELATRELFGAESKKVLVMTPPTGNQVLAFREIEFPTAALAQGFRQYMKSDSPNDWTISDLDWNAHLAWLLSGAMILWLGIATPIQIRKARWRFVIDPKQQLLTIRGYKKTLELSLDSISKLDVEIGSPERRRIIIVRRDGNRQPVTESFYAGFHHRRIADLLNEALH